MARKNGTSHSNGNGHTVAEDIASIEREIGQLMHDIEARVGRLNALAKRSARGAAEDASEFVRRQCRTLPTACAMARAACPTRLRGSAAMPSSGSRMRSASALC